MHPSAIGSDGIAWRPDAGIVERSQLSAFLRFSGLDSWEALQERAISDTAWFTGRVLEFLQIQFDPQYERVLDLSQGLPWARWCVGGGLNICGHILNSRLSDAADDAVAVISEGEEGETRLWSWRELAGQVRRCAAGMRACGIARGDTVGIHLPMLPETVAALLAAGWIGAIAVPLFSGYGPSAIESRLADVKAKALFTCDGFRRRGTIVPAYEAAREAAARCPSIAHVFVLPQSGLPLPGIDGRVLLWDQLLALGTAGGAARCEPEETSAEDPLLVLYSSGTTGRPKGILHSHCGFPIKAAQDMAFGTDVGPGDRILWVTDIGWMMGPWLIYGALMLRATLVLYDGAPDFPAVGRLWDVCARHRVGILGVSPTLVRAFSAYDLVPRDAFDLSALRILASTGEPWNPEPWWWLFRNVGGEKLPIINYSGGTEVSGGILMGNPLLPMKPCSFPAACPGMAADVVDENGNSLRGSVGELVIRGPWIGMARGFWNDAGRYLETYWKDFPGIWRHGDWARIDEDGHWYILGRSDDTLKIAGKRVGPAEIESVLVSHPEVKEAAVVGVPDKLKGSVAIAFCIPVAGEVAGDDLARELRRRVEKELGKPLRPDRVLFVSDLPRTRNAKLMRRVIRSAYLGLDAGNVTSLENPGAVEEIRQLGRANSVAGE